MRVISPDWAAILDRLESWARAVVSSDPNTLGVLLFGSLARDQHAPGSDADLIVVVGASDREPAERVDAVGAPRVALPVDLTVYTMAELERLVAERLEFVRRALTEGRWLAIADGWQPPAVEG